MRNQLKQRLRLTQLIATPGLTSQRHSVLISFDSENFQVCFSAVLYLKICEQRWFNPGVFHVLWISAEKRHNSETALFRADYLSDFNSSNKNWHNSNKFWPTLHSNILFVPSFQFKASSSTGIRIEFHVISLVQGGKACRIFTNPIQVSKYFLWENSRSALKFGKVPELNPRANWMAKFGSHAEETKKEKSR